MTPKQTFIETFKNDKMVKGKANCFKCKYFKSRNKKRCNLCMIMTPNFGHAYFTDK